MRYLPGSIVSAACLAASGPAFSAITVSDFQLSSTELSFQVFGTFPTAPAYSGDSFYFTNPALSADPGFVLNGVHWASSFNFSGNQALRPGEPIGTGVTLYGDYFWVVFENDLVEGEAINGTVTATWSSPVFDVAEVSSLELWWGAGGPPVGSDARFDEGVFISSIPVPEPSGVLLVGLGAGIWLWRRPGRAR